MAGMKKLINLTGQALKVTLVVREGDSPRRTAGTVDVALGAVGDFESNDPSEKEVSYGSDSDIYLNGIETAIVVDGAPIIERRTVTRRGSTLDNELNMRDTITFHFDGTRVLIAVSNSYS